MSEQLDSRSARHGLKKVLAGSGPRAALVVIAAVVTLMYSILLPYDYTQRLSFANWAYLTPELAAWSVALGVGMAFVILVQAQAMRRVAYANVGTVGGLAFVASLLPSFLCSTPVIPTLLAFGGLSAVSLYTATGALQHFFAVYQTPFLAGSLAVIVGSAWWGLRQVNAAACLAEDGCGDSASGTRRPSVDVERAEKAGWR